MKRAYHHQPGGVDAHCHLQEPELFGKGSTADTFETGSRSAVCGGTTTIIPFAPQRKTEDSLIPALEAAHVKANGNCYADYSLHMLVGNPSETTLSEFGRLRHDEGISSLKIYMTYEALRLHDSQILDVLLEARKQQITTMIHAENDDIIQWMTRQLEKRKLFEPKYHSTSHPMVAETEATYRAICLSEFIDAPILIVHVSSPIATKHIREAQQRGLPIYAETCPQYLFLTKHDLDKPGFEGAKVCCSPPPRDHNDQQAIWDGLVDSTFTILSSDHCPFRYDDHETGKKSSMSDEYPLGHFKHIPNGISGVETRLPLVMSAKRLEVQRFVEVTSTNAAKLYGVYPQKGAAMKDISDADLVIWYPGELPEFELKNEMLHHNVDYTAFEGKKLKQWPKYTILRGKVVWDRDGPGLVGRKGYGKFIKRGPSTLAGSRSTGEWDIVGF